VKLSNQDIVDAGIRLIGIKGQSGVGKSTAADTIRNNSKHSIVLPGDFYLFQVALENNKLAEQIYGRTFSNMDEIIEHFFRHESTDLIRKNCTLTIPYVEEMFLHDIGNLLKQKFIPNPIIAEHHLLNLHEQVWALTTDKMSIRAPIEVLARNQIIREGQDTSEKRRAALPTEWYDVGEQGTIINNTGSLAAFKKKVKSFYQSIDIGQSKIY